MAQPAPLSTAERVRRAAYDALAAADAFEIPSLSTVRAEMLIHSVEQAAIDMRAAVRGPGACT
jgi:hypothetical protein